MLRVDRRDEGRIEEELLGVLEVVRPLRDRVEAPAPGEGVLVAELMELPLPVPFVLPGPGVRLQEPVDRSALRGEEPRVEGAPVVRGIGEEGGEDLPFPGNLGEGAVDVADEVDIEKLREKIPEIKQTMFMRANQIQNRLISIFAECGIAFKIVPNFKGAPVQGFIKKTEDSSLILCMTLRQKFADIFWFTLFHEIAHILNGDTKREFIDFDSVSGEAESKADSMAGEFLIDPKAYRSFVGIEGYRQPHGIEDFARQQNVRDYIVQGRLMKEEIIPWKARPRYEWA